MVVRVGVAEPKDGKAKEKKLKKENGEDAKEEEE